MTLTEVLQYHAVRYPQMKPVDVVRLIYENEFGGGRDVSDVEESLNRIKSELLIVKSDRNMPLTEPVGDGYVRVNLAAIKDHGITPERLNEMYLKSSRVSVRNTFSFRKKLQEMEELHYEKPLFGFSGDELKYFLYDYARRGYPAVSHSPEYRAAYHPAYRVVKEEYLK